MIIFKRLRYKNFLSTGDQFTEITLDKSASTLVFGANGAGKSTMLDALAYGLFGKPYRNVNIPQLINTINGRDMMVEIDFKIGKTNYMIRRGKRPRIFEIYINRKMLKQDANPKDYQVKLETNILKLNYRSFCQVVVLGSSTFVPFMRLPAAERRFIIEDLLDIRIFSAMNVVLKEKLVKVKETLTETNNKLEITNEKVIIQEKYLETLKLDNKKKISDSKRLIKENQDKKIEVLDKIKTIRREIDELLSNNVDADAARKKFIKLESLHEQIGENITKAENTIEFYAQTENCPTCKQEIDDTFKDRIIQDKQIRITELQEGLAKLENEIQIAKLRIETITQSMTQVKQREKSLQRLNGEINAIDTYITKVQNEIEELLTRKENTDQEKERIEELRGELVALQKKREKLTEEKHYYEIIAMMLKDTGIKTKIIKQYLPIINKHINKYLSDLDFFVNFSLDENFKESIKSRGRDEFSYESFSEGQKLRIDLAILFTWRDIARLKNSASTNLLIMDEILDRSLDSIGIDEFLKLMNQLWHGLNIFIISPRGEIFMDKFPNSIKFQEVKNFSVMVND